MEPVTEKQHHKISDADERKDFVKAEPSKHNSEKMDVVWQHLRHRRDPEDHPATRHHRIHDNTTTLMGRSSTMVGHFVLLERQIRLISVRFHR